MWRIYLTSMFCIFVFCWSAIALNDLPAVSMTSSSQSLNNVRHLLSENFFLYRKRVAVERRCVCLCYSFSVNCAFKFLYIIIWTLLLIILLLLYICPCEPGAIFSKCTFLHWHNLLLLKSTNCYHCHCCTNCCHCHRCSHSMGVCSIRCNHKFEHLFASGRYRMS